MRVLITVLIVLCAACGGSSPTAPPAPSIPTVGGNYSGSSTFTYPELQATVVCPTTTVVTQSGGTVSIAPLVLGGQCGNMSIPFGEMTINTNGSLGSETGTFNEPSCGTYSYSASGGFFGRELRASMTATSSTCWNFNLTIVLTR